MSEPTATEIAMQARQETIGDHVFHQAWLAIRPYLSSLSSDQLMAAHRDLMAAIRRPSPHG